MEVSADILTCGNTN